jgi:hypothetical protein
MKKGIREGEREVGGDDVCGWSYPFCIFEHIKYV